MTREREMKQRYAQMKCLAARDGMQKTDESREHYVTIIGQVKLRGDIDGRARWNDRRG